MCIPFSWTAVGPKHTQKELATVNMSTGQTNANKFHYASFVPQTGHLFKIGTPQNFQHKGLCVTHWYYMGRNIPVATPTNGAVSP